MPISSSHAVTFKRAPVPTATSETNGKRGNIVTRFLAAVIARISPSKPKDAKLETSGKLKTEIFQVSTAHEFTALKPTLLRAVSQTSLEAQEEMIPGAAQQAPTRFRPLPATPGTAQQDMTPQAPTTFRPLPPPPVVAQQDMMPQASTTFRSLPATPGTVDVQPAPVMNKVPPAPPLPKGWEIGPTRSIGVQTDAIDLADVAGQPLMPQGERKFNAADLLAQKGQLKPVKPEDPAEKTKKRVLGMVPGAGDEKTNNVMKQLAQAVAHFKIAE